MSTITKEFTKEQLQQIIETDHVQCGEASSLARVALASLEAEAVHQVYGNSDDTWSDVDEDEMIRLSSDGEDTRTLYTAPPAPASVPDEVSWEDVPEEITEYDMALASAWAHGFNQCRAAMLQAEPVSNSDELPLDYLQGHKDGLEWAAQLAEANHPQTGDWLYDDPIDLARAISKGPDMPTAQAGNHTEQHLDMVDHSGDANKMVAGNSPVIPDGWKLVPIDPTKDMLRAGQSVVGFWLNTVHCYSKMLAAAPAAPQQEVK
ncbi:Uncharacterised protein [Escherichia coli]|jgi:hypothetical protein|nr:DUF551 domain-containing protein [Escherichia coli]MDY8353365.1 hypothetical protein [Escherichia coli]MDY8435760.1 hypothetical protein [Escherichia coli]MDY8595731.1 hypothetical protein [Escherichia coli]VVX91115.1 Uncharacterised protein [Escherichia coli]VVY01979.1 Uncharacterised protein [Escherichia coli]